MTKQLYFVRHAETEMPGDYDFRLSRAGRADARRIGRHIAGKVKGPVVFLSMDQVRTREMVDILRSTIRAEIPGVLTGAATLRGLNDHTIELRPTMLIDFMRRLDGLTKMLDGKTPETVIFVINRAHNFEYDLLRFMLTHRIDAAAGTAEIDQACQVYWRQQNRYDYGETVGLRMDIENWSDIVTGCGTVIEQLMPKDLRAEGRRARQTRPAPT